MTDFESPGVFDNPDPWERWRLHQHAKGRLPKDREGERGAVHGEPSASSRDSLTPPPGAIEVRGEGPPPRDSGTLTDAVVGPLALQQAGPPPPRDMLGGVLSEETDRVGSGEGGGVSSRPEASDGPGEGA